MAPHDPVQDDPDSRAERVFLDWLGHEGADGPALEALCQDHPELEPELRELWRDWNFVDRHRSRAEQEADGACGGERGPSVSRFEIRGELGFGGMGVVYDVFDRELCRHLAVKVSRARHGGRAHHRFIAEALVTAQLDHPGIVPIHELGIDAEGQAYFSMRRIEGEDLSQVFERVGRGKRRSGESAAGSRTWTLAGALEVLVRVCDTLAFAHARGVVHRDLKPANVMVGRFGEVYVVDWGLAKIVGGTEGEPTPRRSPEAWRIGPRGASEDPERPSTPEASFSTFEGDVLGTPAYMPPEQADGHHDGVGVAGDVYAIGAMLYHLLAGRAPYAEHGVGSAAKADVLSAVRAGPPESLERAAGDLPPELVSICERAMARDPRARYAGVADLGGDLRAFLEQRVVKAHATGPVIEARKWVARNRPLALGLGFAALALVAALALELQKTRALERAGREIAFENYVANIALASEALRRGDVLQAARHLEACPEELRNWEWTHTFEQLDGSEHGLHRPDLQFFQPAFHPSGAWLACSSWDGKTLVVDAEHEPVAELEGGSRYVKGADFSDDGRWLATAGAQLRLWETAGWTLARELDLGSDAQALAYEPGGARLAVVTSVGNQDGGVACFDPLAVEAAPSPDFRCEAIPWSVDWSPDGRRLVTSWSDGLVRLLDVTWEGLRLHSSFSPADLTFRSFWCVKFDSSGERIALGLPDGAVTTWRVDTGERLDLLRGHGAIVTDVAFLDDSTLVSTSFDATAIVWDLGEQRAVRRLLGHRRVINRLAVSRVDRRLATAGPDCKLLTWRLDEQPASEVSVACERLPQRVSASPDGELMAVSGIPVELRELRTGRLRWRADGIQGYPSFARDGRLIYVTSATYSGVRALDAERGELRFELPGEPSLELGASAVDPTGGYLASARGDLALWDLRSRRLVTQRRGVRAAAFHPSQPWIACAGDERGLELAELPGLEAVRVFERPASRTWGLAFAPDGARIAGALDDGQVCVWDVDTGGLVWSRAISVQAQFAVAFDPSGERLATGSLDGRVRLLEARGGAQVLSFVGFSLAAQTVLWSPDGRSLIATSDDGTLRIWNTQAPARTAAGLGHE